MIFRSPVRRKTKVPLCLTRSVQRILAVALIGASLLAGCGSFQRNKIDAETAETAVREARVYLETIRSIEVGERYAQDIGGAATAFDHAQIALSEGATDEASRAARRSVEISRNLLTEFYQNTVSRLAREARAELETTLTREPEHPVAQKAETLDRVTAYGEKIAEAPTLVSIERVIRDLDQVLAVSTGMKSSWTETLGADVSFDRGRYELSERGRTAVRDFITSVIREIEERYRDRTVDLHVKVLGYTDQLNFGIGTDLVRRLTEGVEDRMPETDPERRRFLNQRLSEYRARTIGDHIDALIREIGGDGIDYRTRLEVIGYGEKVPSGVAPPYPASDGRRRICKIHVYAAARSEMSPK